MRCDSYRRQEQFELEYTLSLQLSANRNPAFRGIYGEKAGNLRITIQHETIEQETRHSAPNVQAIDLRNPFKRKFADADP